MKRKYMMLSMLIFGPKQWGNDIDVYLTPLIEDLKILWENGVEVYDGYRKESLNLRAMLFGTINIFRHTEIYQGIELKVKKCVLFVKNTQIGSDWNFVKRMYFSVIIDS